MDTLLYRFHMFFQVFKGHPFVLLIMRHTNLSFRPGYDVSVLRVYKSMAYLLVASQHHNVTYAHPWNVQCPPPPLRGSVGSVVQSVE